MQIIGRSDRFDFDEFQLRDLKVKTDTGAQTSSIHCTGIELVEGDEGKRVSFILLDPSHEQYTGERIERDVCKIRRVKSSNGQSETRYSIKTKVTAFGRSYTIELTLADRRKMKFPVLLGRQWLAKKFMVDVTKKDLSYKLKGD